MFYFCSRPRGVGRLFSLAIISEAAGARGIEWFFAEPEAAKRAEEVFGDSPGRFGKIKVRYEPALVY
jgi:hypothetical protein